MEKKATRRKLTKEEREARTSENAIVPLVPASHIGIPPANPDVKPEAMATENDFSGAKGLMSLGRPKVVARASTALAKIEAKRVIKGDRSVYAVCQGQVFDVANGEEPPLLAGMVVYHVPMDRKEIMRAVLWGWDEAAKEIKDIADSASEPISKAAAISGLMQSAQKQCIYASDMDGHTRYAHDMGYRMGLRFELIKYPDIMVFLPTAGIQGGDERHVDLKTEIEKNQQPMAF